jgi:ATP-dependent RNA helicase DeaD
VPFDTESYVHRIGRTGRAGRQGDAILFITGRERNMLGQIERATKQKISDYEFPTLDILNGRKIAGLLENINKQLDADVSEYEKLVKDLLEASDLSSDDLLLGFISLVQSGKPFYATPYVASANVRGKERSPRDRDDRGRGRSERSERGERGDRERGPKKAYNDIDLTRYRLAVGEEHGVQKGDIVGAIANEAGISSGKMGKIHLRADHSFIDLPNDLSSDTVNKLKNVFIRGQKINLQASDEAMAPATENKGKKREGNKRFDSAPSAARKKDAAPRSPAKKRDGNDAAPKQRRRKAKAE